MLEAQTRYQTAERLVNEVESNGFSSFYTDALASIEERMNKIDDLIAHDRDQAEKVQESFNDYDKKYFAKYIELSKGNTGKVSQSFLGRGSNLFNKAAF